MLKKRILYAFMLGVCAVLYFFENNTGTRVILLSMLLIPLLSGLCAYLSAKRASVMLEAPESAEENTEVSIEVSCRASFLSWFCSWTAKLAVVLSIDSRLDEAFGICGGKVTEKVRLKTVYPGVYRVNVVGAKYTDVFGLMCFECPAKPETARINVLPVLFGVTLNARDESMGGEAGEGRKQNGYETTGIRDYVPGDSVRLIHWKLTEKLDRPVIREMNAGEAENGILLVLENMPPKACATKAYAECLRSFVSCVRALEENGLDYRIAVNDDYPEIEFHQSDVSFCRQIFESGINRSETVLVFSPCAESDAFLFAEHANTATVVPQDEESGINAIVLNREKNHINI